MADLGGVRGPLWQLVMYFCIHITARVHNDYVAVACSNNNQALKNQKEVYDSKHQPDKLPEGTLVLLENTAQKQCQGGKPCPAWFGPYTISRNLGKGVYKLKNTAGNIVRKKANISRLKVYTCRDGQEPESGKEDNEKGEEESKKEEEEQNDKHECSKEKEKRKQ